MKLTSATLLTATLLLAGCAGSSSEAPTRSPSAASQWWDPTSYHWSKVLPWNWFSSELRLTDQGLGELRATTPMDQAVLSQGLGKGYQLRQGMGTKQGGIVNYFQALREGTPQLKLFGDSQLTRIEIQDERITAPDGIKIGALFSATFDQAYGHCQIAPDSNAVQCAVPNNPHLTYYYQGEFHGPQGLIPDDQTLKNWHLSQIVWQAKRTWS